MLPSYDLTNLIYLPSEIKIVALLCLVGYFLLKFIILSVPLPPGDDDG